LLDFYEDYIKKLLKVHFSPEQSISISPVFISTIMMARIYKTLKFMGGVIIKII